MQFIDSPTELTTSVTDAILFLLALGFSAILHRTGRQRDLSKTRIWLWVFGLLSFSAALGTLAHGIKMSDPMRKMIWQPLNLSLALVVALAVIGVIYDVWRRIPRATVPVILAIGTAVYIVRLIVPGTFIVFVLYAAIALTFALISYLMLAIRMKQRGAWLMATGLLITAVAFGIQATRSVAFALIWQFDHNGVFHILQMLGLTSLFLGLRAELLSRPAASPSSQSQDA